MYPSKLWYEFIDLNRCGLCGNTGILKVRNIEAYCICPNGRISKKIRTGLPKWSMNDRDSIIEIYANEP